jgi:hypothetical protein
MRTQKDDLPGFWRKAVDQKASHNCRTVDARDEGTPFHFHLQPYILSFESLAGHGLVVKRAFPISLVNDALIAPRSDPARERPFPDPVSNELCREVIIIRTRLVCRPVKREISVLDVFIDQGGSEHFVGIAGIDTHPTVVHLGIDLRKEEETTNDNHNRLLAQQSHAFAPLEKFAIDNQKRIITEG